ncbi:glycosyltransferase family 4 protein [Idiomarina abyssalis]|uniref:glycosyltransferase family 4 protein n=1 Tax=Idiomarina abyssalis TaxID=86102 RepID=UPI002D80072E|nr:glycosyltransferase family 4 protein [Idiomarina abyssalis]
MRDAGCFQFKSLVFCDSYKSASKQDIVLGSFLKSPLHIIRIRRHVKEALRSSAEKVVVHAHLTWPFIYVALATLGLNNVSLIFTEHSTSNRRRKVRLLRFIDRFFYERYDKVICISNGVKRSLAEWLGKSKAKKLLVIENGSRAFRVSKRASLKGRRLKIVSVGSLSHQKNFEVGIRAVASVKGEVEKYLIVGEGPERERLEALTSELELEDVVEFLGWLDDVEPYFHKADIQLIPSRREGFGLVAVEGMSTGLPIVASKVEGLNEVLGVETKSVVLVDEIESPEAWAKKILEVKSLILKEGAENLSKASRAQSEKFTINKMAEEYLELYKGLLKS